MSHDNKHIGPSLDEFLEKEGILEEATATAKKRTTAMSLPAEELHKDFLDKLKKLVDDYEEASFWAWIDETINIKVRFGSQEKVWSFTGLDIRSLECPFPSKVVI